MIATRQSNAQPKQNNESHATISFGFHLNYSLKMYSRTNPFHSRIKERFPLTGLGSTKMTYHISLDIAKSGISFKVGDSIGVLPTNDPKVVDQILDRIAINGKEEYFDPRSNMTWTIREYLLHKANLSRVNPTFFKLLCEKEKTRPELFLAENKTKLTTYLDSHTLIELLDLHNSGVISPSEFCKPLMPLMPRFYSIASSQKVFPDEIHLTVAYVSYVTNGQRRFGIGSHFLCDLAIEDKTQIPIYLQPSNHFTLPSDPMASIILIGPGTGIAPYRAFLQERIATSAAGRNWIFFGERNRSTDFYYSDFWLELEKQGRIRLDLAFSRDQNQKVYVQNRLIENKKSVWNWIQQGAILYVCGNAEKMAKDVDAALQSIAQEEGGFSFEDARLYLKSLRNEKRYLLDVY
jgi:sulfite reductase (NADPH) flavoprotein alpha-component